MFLASILGSVASSAIGGLTASKAAKEQSKAAERAGQRGLEAAYSANNYLANNRTGYLDNASAQSDLARQNYLRNYEAIKPLRSAGMVGLQDFKEAARRQSGPTFRFNDTFNAPEFDGSVESFEESPYQAFLRDEGNRALTDYAAKQGLGRSGAAMRDMVDYNQNASGAFFDDWRSDQLQDYNLAYGAETDRFAREYGLATDQYNRDVAQQANYFDRLGALVGLADTGTARTIANNNNFALTKGNIFSDLSRYDYNTASQMGSNLINGVNGANAANMQAANARAQGLSGINDAVQGGFGNIAKFMGMKQAGYFGDTEQNGWGLGNIFNNAGFGNAGNMMAG
jgi:hypothetical protein